MLIFLAIGLFMKIKNNILKIILAFLLLTLKTSVVVSMQQTDSLALAEKLIKIRTKNIRKVIRMHEEKIQNNENIDQHSTNFTNSELNSLKKRLKRICNVIKIQCRTNINSIRNELKKELIKKLNKSINGPQIKTNDIEELKNFIREYKIQITNISFENCMTLLVQKLKEQLNNQEHIDKLFSQAQGAQCKPVLKAFSEINYY